MAKSAKKSEVYGVSINSEIVAVFGDADLAQQFRKKFYGAATGKVVPIGGKMPADPKAKKSEEDDD